MILPKRLKSRDLVLLGLLMDQPRYGYEVKVLLENALTHLVNINTGSLYYRLKQLQKQGYVHEAAVEKIGRRPERSVYELTEQGHQAFLEGINRQIFPAIDGFDPLDLVLYFLHSLDRPTIARKVAMRQSMLINLSSFFGELLNTGSTPLERCHRLLIQHKRAVIDMEIAYIGTLLNELSDGNLLFFTEPEESMIVDSSRIFIQAVESGLWADKDLRLCKLD